MGLREVGWGLGGGVGLREVGWGLRWWSGAEESGVVFEVVEWG